MSEFTVLFIGIGCGFGIGAIFGAMFLRIEK